MQLKEQAKERERKRKEEKVLNQLNHVTADKFIYLDVSFYSPFHAELITCRLKKCQVLVCFTLELLSQCLVSSLCLLYNYIYVHRNFDFPLNFSFSYLLHRPLCHLNNVLDNLTVTAVSCWCEDLKGS